MADSANGGLGSTMQKKDCLFFVDYGYCSFGQNCKYNHPPNDGSKVVQDEGRIENLYAYNYSREKPCKFYHAGTCRYGLYCEFNHLRPDLHLQYNSDGLPMRLGEHACPFYLRNRECGYGTGCKFHHPEIKLSAPDQEYYGFHASGEAQAKESDEGPFEITEYDDGGPSEIPDEGYSPVSTTDSPFMP